MFCLIVAKVQTGDIFSSVPISNLYKIDLKNGDSSIHKNATGLFYEIGSVSKLLIMAIGLPVGKISMADLYDVTNSKIGQHQI